MKSTTKKIIYTLLLCVVFTYGLAVGLYKIFPLPQLLALKHYVEQERGTFEAQHQTEEPPDSVEVYETFLQKLLVKKIQIPDFSGHGGGLSTSGNLLYIMKNKGSLQIYDLINQTIVENDVSDVPMNFSELIKSGHPYKNDFRINTFRVNGLYSEYVADKTHAIFVSHNAYDAGRDCITHNISRAELQVTDQHVSQKTDWETIFTASPCLDPVPDNIVSIIPYPGHISGGAITNFDEQNLLVSVGDYDRHGISGTDEWAMDSANTYGKLILVDKNSGEWSIYTTGNRNASGLYIDRNSTIWSVENGPKGGDELNILAEGETYGWPKVSYGIWYDPTLKFTGGQKVGTHSEYKKPVFSWVPSIAPSSLSKIEGDKFQLWKDDLLLGTMRDQSLHRLRLDQDNRVVYDERINIGHRIRDLTTLPDDKIALITDDAFLVIIDDGGAVFDDMDLDIRKRMTQLDKFDQIKTEIDTLAAPYASSAKMIFEQNCVTCHNLNLKNQIGPHLNELLGREIGGVDNFTYSHVLKEDKRMWNPELLKSFLTDPEDEFPGNRMQKINLSPGEADSLVQFLQTF